MNRVHQVLVLLSLLVVAGCQAFLNGDASCTPSFEGAPVISYRFEVDNVTTESEARIAVVASDGDYLVVVRDTGAYDTEIEFKLQGSRTVDVPLRYDPSLSVETPDDFPVVISGVGPSGEGGGLFYGTITITQMAETAMGAAFEVEYFRAAASPVQIEGSFDTVIVQACR